MRGHRVRFGDRVRRGQREIHDRVREEARIETEGLGEATLSAAASVIDASQPFRTSFSAEPLPIAPSQSVRRPIVSKIGSSRLGSASSPAARISSLSSRAGPSLPETGASTNEMPCSCARREPLAPFEPDRAHLHPDRCRGQRVEGAVVTGDGTLGRVAIGQHRHDHLGAASSRGCHWGHTRTRALECMRARRRPIPDVHRESGRQHLAIGAPIRPVPSTAILGISVTLLMAVPPVSGRRPR